MVDFALRRKTLCAVAASVFPTPGVAANLVPIIATSKRSVLPVGTYGATDSPRFTFRGSGFVIGSGHLVATNFHVLPGNADIEKLNAMSVLIGGKDGEEIRGASIVATDRVHDLAILRMQGAPLPALELSSSTNAQEGQEIALIGYPIGGALGFSPVTHRGIIASITTIALPASTAQQLDPRAVMRLRQGNFQVYQLDATAYPGNSGGPIVDAQSGQVLGTVNMVLVRGTRESALSNPTGITYGIPVRHLIELMRGL